MEKELDKSTTTNRTRKQTTVLKSVEDIKPSDRVSIDNLCDWDIYFSGIENNKDIVISGGVKNYRNLTVAEVDAQVKVGNFVFCGTDGSGTHASIRINDPLIREYVFQEQVDPIQLTEDNVKKVLDIDDKNEFKKALSELVVLKHEKRMINRIVERIGRDDMPSYKIVAIEKLSGIKFED